MFTNLVDCSANKLRRVLAASHHIRERVFIALGPELVKEFDIVLNVESPGVCVLVVVHEEILAMDRD